MSLLFDAATAWNNLSNVEYEIFLSLKGKRTFLLKLRFLNEYFFHLSGIHYASDIDFGVRRYLYSGERLVPAVLTGRIDSSKIELSARYQEKIEGRLRSIVNLENTLDGEFEIAKFNKDKLPFHCQIEADYIIRNKDTDDIFFVFISEDVDYCYCKTTFINNNMDYLRNQTKLTVLKKTKIVNGIETIRYVHPNYNPNITV